MPATMQYHEGIAEPPSSVRAQFSVMQTQLSGLVNAVATTQGQVAVTQAQLAGVVARLDMTIEEFNATRAKLDSLMTAHTAFRSKAETSFGIVRWMMVFLAVVLIIVILGLLAVARSVGSLEATVQHQQKTLDDIRREASELHGKHK